MYNFALIVLCFALSVPLCAQPELLWNRTFGGAWPDEFTKVISTPDGFVITGWTESFGSGFQDFSLIKSNADGQQLWDQTYGGPHGDHCQSVFQTRDGGYILGGSAEFGTDGRHAWIVRTNSNGDSLWSREFGESIYSQCEAILEIDDGFVFAGGTLLPDEGYYNFWLARLNANGDQLWQRTYGGENEEYCTALLQTADGGFILSGWVDETGNGDYDYLLMKTAANGDSLWSRTYGGMFLDQCRNLKQTADGGFLLAGTTLSFGSGTGDFWIVKTDQDGHEQWNRAYGGASWESCTGAEQASDGGYILTGSTFSFADPDSGNAYVVKTDAVGDTLWTREFGGSNFDYGMDVVESAQSEFVVAGATASFGAGSFDAWLVKLGETSAARDAKTPADFDVAMVAAPNPLNAATKINLTVPRAERATLTIVDLLGRQVRKLHDGLLSAGSHTFTFDGANLPSGIYIAQAQSGDKFTSQKLLLLK